MKLYFAPLEGITGYIYRNAYRDVIEEGTHIIDKYFSPFISPGVNQPLSRKEIRDILPENNKNICLIPQLLGCRAEDILLGIKAIKELGYNEVNINLGCPSGTVVAKKKGSGLLAYTEDLDEFLYKIYEKADIKISVKTRIGKNSPDEFYEIMDIYNKYPMEELIIHPRIQTDFYKNTPNMEMFNYATANSKNRLCYNGDIICAENYKNIVEKYTGKAKTASPVESIMIGRGFIRNPMLIYEIKSGETKDAELSEHKKKLKRFHDRLLEDYTEEMSGERPVLFKMKELWAYMGDMFTDSEKLLKKLRKTESLEKYKAIVGEILQGGVISES